MTSSHEPPLADYLPPSKRPRVDNPQLQTPHNPIPGPAGPSTVAVPDQDGGADSASKKNRKRPLSCGECRRLKLKSCCKRGCAEICPDGALTGGKGSRFILANTEQLHEKIKSMSQRIRALEDALHELQSGHPLLREELLDIKKSADLFGVDPSQAQSSGGDRRNDAQHGLVNSLSPHMLSDRQSHSPPVNGHREDYNIPPDILGISHRFPAPNTLSVDLNPTLRKRILDLLPPQNEARYLCEQAAEHAAWHQNSDGSDGVPNLVHSVYNGNVETMNPHRLSYFLIILAIGTCVDQRRSPRAWSHDAERFHHLSRAALCETSVINEPSIDAINALFYMSRYLSMFSPVKEAVEYAWAVMGIATKLAIGIGLHRASTRSKVIPEELDKRKTLLWCMLNVDHRLSLMLRRPPSISLRYVDVDPPASSEYPAQGPREIYQRWHYTFTTHCISPILEMAASTTPAPYSEILMLDSRIRNFEVPAFMQVTPGTASGNALCVVQAWTHMTREVAILNLHRQYFTQALGEGFWANHKYATSVVAVYQAALSLLWCLETYYRQQPEYSVRSQMLWSNGLSSAIALSLLVTRVPPSVMASNALLELAKVLRLFTDVCDRCPLAAKSCSILETLFQRSRSTYLHSRYGTNPDFPLLDDEVCKIGVRSGAIPPPVRSSVPVGTETELATFPLEGTHSALIRAYEEATSTVPPPNDPILIPGPIHLGPSASINSPSANVSRNGAGPSPGMGGFGVSAERSGCQNDLSSGYGSIANMNVPVPTAGFSAAIAAGAPQTPQQQPQTQNQNFKWLSAEYSDNGWMTWF
ncbi:transcription factor [Ganoderma sinense ZZ0214-1]|uniref:Transcription factor n=1 Tax=Ganoderma sinense ZZ0214-1 TaxID=1077348 RepID=A0A2G8RLY5_9APHY|nr:transcription factor [Ganoderma sinense ZZ0214-1]